MIWFKLQDVKIWFQWAETTVIETALRSGKHDNEISMLIVSWVEFHPLYICDSCKSVGLKKHSATRIVK
jgi:hypothetical protein